MSSPYAPDKIQRHRDLMAWALDALEAPAPPGARIAALARSAANPHDRSTVTFPMGAGLFALSSGAFFAPLALSPSAGAGLFAASFGAALIPALAAGAARAAETASLIAPSAARRELSRSGSRLKAFSAAARAVARSIAAHANPALPRAIQSAPARLQAAALRPAAALASALPGPDSWGESLREAHRRSRLALISHDGQDDRDWLAGRAARALELAAPEVAEAFLYRKLAFDRLRDRAHAGLAQMARLCAQGAEPLSDREQAARHGPAPLGASPLTPGPLRLQDALDMIERLDLNPLYRPAAHLPTLLEAIETQGAHKPGLWEIESPYIQPRLEALAVKAEARALSAVVGEARPAPPRSSRPRGL